MAMGLKPRPIVSKTEPTIDMGQLASDLGRRDAEHLRYAPPAVRESEIDPSNQITSFGGLPTRELDEIVAAAEAEIANLKRDAQVVRDVYVKHTQRITEDVKRLRESVKLGLETIKQLHEQSIKLYQPLHEVLAEERAAHANEDEHDRIHS